MTNVFAHFLRGAETLESLRVTSEEQILGYLSTLADNDRGLLVLRDGGDCSLHVGGGPIHFQLLYADEKGRGEVPLPRSPGTEPIVVRAGPSNVEVTCPADQLLSREEAELVVTEFFRTGRQTSVLEWMVID